MALHSLKDHIHLINYQSLLAAHHVGCKLYHIICKGLACDSSRMICYGVEVSALRAELHQAQQEHRKCSTISGDVTDDVRLRRHPWIAIKSRRWNEYLLRFTDRLSKITKTVPMKGISTGEVDCNFINAWIFNSGPMEELMTENGVASRRTFLSTSARSSR